MRRSGPDAGGGPDGAQAQVALIDGDLRIVEVNEAWRTALRAVRPREPDGGVGEDYAHTLRLIFPRLDVGGLLRELVALRDGDRDDISLVAYAGFGLAIRPRRITIRRAGGSPEILRAVHSGVGRPRPPRWR